MMKPMMTCPRCGLRVRRIVGKGRNGPAKHNAHGKPCVRIDAPVVPMWVLTCQANSHNVALLERDGGKTEYFCSDCSAGETV